MPQVITIGSCFVELGSPQPGVSVREARSLLKYASGAATIFAQGLRKLGIEVGIISKVGDDELGCGILDHLTSLGIDISQIGVVSGQLTPISLAWADGRGSKTFYFYRFPGHCDPLGELTRDDLREDYLAACRVFDFGEGSIRNQSEREVAFHAARMARRLGRAVVYAPNLRLQAWAVAPSEVAAIQREAVALCDLLLLNDEEARFIAETQDDGRAISALQQLGSDGCTVVVTRGPGEITVAAGVTRVHLPSFAVPVVYDIGAGDTFHAGYVAAHLRGHDPADCARHAAAAAAIKISASASPDDLPTWEQVEQFLASRS